MWLSGLEITAWQAHLDCAPKILANAKKSLYKLSKIKKVTTTSISQYFVINRFPIKPQLIIEDGLSYEARGPARGRGVCKGNLKPDLHHTTFA